jgi:hypothetical protein
MTVGALSMAIISLPWEDKITFWGSMATIVATLTLTFWLRFKDRFSAGAKGRQNRNRQIGAR